ncbi:MAG: AAA family ATPase, partial [Chloroflexota bacterium]
GTEDQVRLLQEARAVARLNHPNIVTVHDVGEYEDTPFIVMEFIAGQSLEEQKPTNIDEIIVLAQQICDALGQAHEQGIVHRDIKPANVIVATNGTAKLMDFGIARSQTSKLTEEGAILGTLNYIAPEQAMGEAVDGRADLYALGVMLYELTTGRLPFEADTPLAVITQHLHAPVVPPRAKNSAIPPALDALILQLMAKEPEQRPESAAALRTQLATLGEEENISFTADEDVPTLSRIVRGRLVGRKSELDEARTYWRQARDGQGQVLLISGEPGVGKTRLVQEIATLAEVSRGTVLTGECFAEGSAPYTPVAQIIREALSQTPLDLPDLVLADLITITPDLQARYPQIQPNPPLEPSAEQQRLFESVVSLCITLSNEAPLLLFLDDLHWADSGTVYLVRYLARRLKTSPVLLVATYREIELSDDHPFQEILLDFDRTRSANRLKLARLKQEETQALLEALFAETVADDFIDAIYRETEGNPFFIEEVCKALVESGTLYFEAGIWHLPTMSDLQIPQSIRSTIQARVARLSSNVQRVLQQAAIIGREFGFALLLEVSGMDEDELLDVLDEAYEAQLLEETKTAKGEGYSFVHALIPTTLRDNLSNLRRARVHRKIAAVLETDHPDDYEALAYHYGEAGDETQALANLTKAAQQAQRVYANEDAVRYYTEALDLVPDDDPEYFELLAARMTLLNLLSRSEDELADIDQLLSLAEQQGDKQRQIDILIAKTDNDLTRASWGVPPRALELAERAVNLAEAIDDQVRNAHA